MRVVVTGGAGYIGSITVRALLDAGHAVTVLDNLENGHRDAVDPRANFEEVDLTDRALEIPACDAVIHFAGLIQVAESMEERDRYWRVNVEGTRNLVRCMKIRGVGRIVFSSSAAVYGNPKNVPIPEDAPLRPVNPYGETKVAVEELLRDEGLQYVALRYFNAAGASDDAALGERHTPETHLIPLALSATEAKPIRLFGTDYDTPDGTCIRDFVHVEDLARAHVLAVEYLQQGGKSCAINLGSGQGYSVREILAACSEARGILVPIELAERRDGDPPQLVADIQLAARVLRWRPERNIQGIVATAWRFAQQ